MKLVDSERMAGVSGRRLDAKDTFRFQCHAGLSCFNRCCRNLNLFLYPYDVLRLRRGLGVDTDSFLEKYTDVLLRKGNFFPEVLLRMEDGPEKNCIFLSREGCRVYPDRPDTCRSFPVAQGVLFGAGEASVAEVSFFAPPPFCQGSTESKEWDIFSWRESQKAGIYFHMTAKWAALKRRFVTSPWGAEGPSGPRAKMAFMAAYNLDRFRDFVFRSSFLNRYVVQPGLVEQAREDDLALLTLGFSWIPLFLWGVSSPDIQPKSL